MASGRLIDYLGNGTAAARPASPSLTTGGIGFYYATDTEALSVWDGAAWNAVSSGGGFGTFSGALVTKTADETAANYSAGAAIPWTTETGGYDTDAYHDNASNNSRLTIPSTGKYIFHTMIEIGSGTLTSSDFARICLSKNGALGTALIGGIAMMAEISAAATIWITGVSAPIDCTAADYFEMWLDTESDTSITVAAKSSFGVRRVS